MIVQGFLVFLTGVTGGTMVVLVTNLFRADAAGILGPGSTSGMFMLLGLSLAGLGMWGRKKTGKRSVEEHPSTVVTRPRE